MTDGGCASGYCIKSGSTRVVIEKNGCTSANHIDADAARVAIDNVVIKRDDIDTTRCALNIDTVADCCDGIVVKAGSQCAASAAVNINTLHTCRPNGVVGKLETAAIRGGCRNINGIRSSGNVQAADLHTADVGYGDAIAPDCRIVNLRLASCRAQSGWVCTAVDTNWYGQRHSFTQQALSVLEGNACVLSAGCTVACKYVNCVIS